MFTFNTLNLLIIISHFFWPFIRILSFLSTAPIFNEKIITSKIKIILAFLISWLIFPFLPEIHIPLFSGIGLILFLQQILIGIVLGFSFQLLFATINLSGEIAGLQMGLSFATFFSSYINIGSSIISRLLNVLMLFFFLSLNMHLYLISILLNSFYILPINENILQATMFLALLKFSGCIFINSIIFVLPITIILLSLNIVMSILNRISPQISIFSIGFSLNLLIGILVIYFLTPIIFPFFNTLLQQSIFFASHIFD